LSSKVPSELLPLSSGLNSLLGAERARHAQYRHLIDDLAHNLKTPLSVLQNEAERSTSRANSPVDASLVTTEVDRIRESIDRSVQRAHIKAPRYLAPLISVEPAVRRVITSLEKLYQHQGIHFDLDLADAPLLRMDHADLLELFGNVAENACKYGASDIKIVATTSPRSVIFSDNGPGFPPGELAMLTQRGARGGTRADSQAQGDGMGLAAAHQLMESHGGTLSLSNAENGLAMM